MSHEITFLSTVITSSAALVAIIAGFLVSRVISISSEQNAINRRIKSLRVTRRGVEEKYDHLEERIKEQEYQLLEFPTYLETFMSEMNINEFIDGKHVEIVSTDFLYESINREDFNYLSEEEIKAHIQKLKNFLYQLGGIKKQHYEYNYDDVRKLINHNHFPKDERKEKVLFERFEVLVQEFSYLGLEDEIRLINENGENLTQINNDIISLDKEIKGQEHLLTEYANPSGVCGALVVLTLSIIVGVILPSIVLTLRIEFFGWKWWLFGFFIAHVILICIYLWKFVIDLNDNAKQNSS